MKKTKLALVVLLVLFVVMLAFLVPFVQPVSSQTYEPIYIRADGSVEGTDKIVREGNLYTFTDNISSEIIIERSNVIVDGGAHVLQGTGRGYGLKIKDVNNVTIKNMQIRNFGRGIYVFYDSHHNVISGNKIEENNWGIYLRGSHYNTIEGNVISNNSEYGVHFSGSDNLLRNNTIQNSKFNFGIMPGSENNDIDTSNTVNGKPIIYWYDKHYLTVPSGAGYVALVNCTNIVVQNLDLANNWQGIMLVHTKNSTITKNKIAFNLIGIKLSYSPDNTISENTIADNMGDGIQVWDSHRVHIIDNYVANNVEIGIKLFDSRNGNMISGNTITTNGYGIHFRASSNNNTVSNNELVNNYHGIFLSGSAHNVFRNNHLNNNNHSLNVEGNPLELFNTIDDSNTINNKPIIYWINQKDKTVPSNAGYVTLLNCTNIIVQNLTLTNQQYGVRLIYTTASKITQNTIKANTVDGIYLLESQNNVVVGNTIFGNSGWGINLKLSHNNNISHNCLSDNGGGILVDDSVENRIVGNDVRTNNGFAIKLYDMQQNNTIYHNNFVDNKVESGLQVSMIWPVHGDAWDNGFEGNYWSDYQTRYPNASESNSSGIADTPFYINENNQDNYPLLVPIQWFEAGIWEWKEYYVDVISNSSVSTFYFTPSEGAFIRFQATGADNSAGFCKVSIPKGLLNSENGWNVFVDDELVDSSIVDEDAENTVLYFTYTHSTRTVEIEGTSVIPEFPSWTVLPVLLIASLVVIWVRKRVVIGNRA